MFKKLLFLFLMLLIPKLGWTSIIMEGDEAFQTKLNKELNLMRNGDRGPVCRELLRRLDTSFSTTTIRPITSDEETWHPNDRKGTRSYVVAADTKLRGGERTSATAAILYLHPSRIDPGLSLFRLGTLVYELSTACDLNLGQFSSDFKTREKRAVFFRNAWCDALHFNLIEISNRIPTTEYQKAKTKGLIQDSYSNYFPILNLEDVPEAAASPPTPQ